MFSLSLPDTKLGLYTLLFCFAAIIAKVIHAIWIYKSYPSAPGPTVALFTDWWYLFKAWGGKFEAWNIRQHAIHGDVIRVGPKMYSINNPEAAQIIYGMSSKMPKSDWYTAWGDPKVPNDNLFSARDRQVHGSMRKQVAGLYSMSTIKDYEPYVDNCITILLDKFHQFEGTSIDIQRWMHCYAFDVIGAMTCGARIGFMDAGEDIDGIMDSLATSSYFATLFGISRYSARLYFLLFGNPASGIGTFIGKAIANRNKTQNEKAADFLTKLNVMEAKSPEDYRKNKADRALGANLAAGSDTTSVTLTAILFYVYRTPQVLERLRAEIAEAEKNGRIDHPITFTQSQALPYLQAVIKEGMRLHSAIGLPMWRVVQEGTAIGTTFFPSGAIVGINSWVAHRNATIFAPDPNTFRPERWIDSSPEVLTRMDRYYLPFGLGTRTCLGKNISILEMTKLVPELIKRVDLDMPDKLEHTNYWVVKPEPLMTTVRSAT